jgi:hypothetical protein
MRRVALGADGPTHRPIKYGQSWLTHQPKTIHIASHG